MTDSTILLAVQKIKHAANDPSSEDILLNNIDGIWKALSLLAEALGEQGTAKE